MQKYLLLLLMPLLLVSCKASSQPGKQYSTSKNRAIKKFESATQAFDRYMYEAAKEDLFKAIKIDDEFVEPHLLLGQIYEEQNKDSLALLAYQQAAEINPNFFMPVHFKIGKLQLRYGNYDKAIQSLSYYQENGRNKTILENCRRLLNNCYFAKKSIANPVPFNPENIGSAINSPFDEFINSMSVDESYIIFTVKQPIDGIAGNKETEDFYYSVKPDKNWLERRKMSRFFNTAGNEGAMFISPDKSFLVFAACGREDGYGSCDLYISYRKGDKWTQPRNMGMHVNSRKWDSHPTIASDNRTVYFVSTRNGGLGSSDIWKTTMLDDGTWSIPQNLGRKINTPRDEFYPFIHPDNETIYFTSAGHTGMGGLDFFMARKQDDSWTVPKNLGYPVNTYRDELGLQVNASGDIAFISTDRLKGEGRFDIYAFDLPEEFRARPVTYMKGIVYNKNTKAKLQAHFELTDLKTSEVIATAFSNPETGEFLLSIPTNRNYALSVKRPGYLFYSDNFELAGVHSQTDPYIKDVPLQPIKVGETIVLKNIFFDYDKYALLPESRVELNRLVTLLNQNPEMNIRIQGHTDSQGDESYNQKLSENRAKSVYDYLVMHGISEERLSYKGYGESKPIADNDTEEGRAKNRRTEFVVVD